MQYGHVPQVDRVGVGSESGQQERGPAARHFREEDADQHHPAADVEEAEAERVKEWRAFEIEDEGGEKQHRSAKDERNAPRRQPLRETVRVEVIRIGNRNPEQQRIESEVSG